MTAKTGQAEQEKQTGQSGQNSQNRIFKAGMLVKTARTCLSDRTARQDSQNRIAWTGRVEKDSHDS
jgi:hypothetical protein